MQHYGGYLNEEEELEEESFKGFMQNYGGYLHNEDELKEESLISIMVATYMTKKSWKRKILSALWSLLIWQRRARREKFYAILWWLHT